MEKIIEEGGQYFNSDIDIRIPVETTIEYKRVNMQYDMVIIIET